MSTDPPVKIIENQNPLSIVCKILTLYKVMLCFNWKWGVSVLFTLDQFGGRCLC